MGIINTIGEVASNPQLIDVYQSTLENTFNSINLSNIPLSTYFRNIILPSRNIRDRVVLSTTDTDMKNFDNIFDNTQFQYDRDISENLFDYFIDIQIQNSNSYFYDKITSNVSDIEQAAFEMLHNSFKNMKKLKTDISNNIQIAHSLFKRLQHYTNTNPNLHLLSKTKNKLQNKIDNYEKHMNIDTKKNKELETSIKNNKNYNYYLIIIYYVVLILFFMFSNFIKNKYYKNIVALIMIILYIIAPFIIKYVIYYIYKLWLYILKKYNLLPENLTYEDIIKYDSYNYENNQENISYI